MTFMVFAAIAWGIITVFILIPKTMDKKENIILFFLLTMIVVSLFTVLDLNLHLIETDKKADSFFCLWVHRNVIIPLALLIFLNLLSLWKNKMEKIAVSFFILMFLFFIEILTVSTGIKKYNDWNVYYGIFTLMALMTTAVFLKIFVHKIEEGAN